MWNFTSFFKKKIVIPVEIKPEVILIDGDQPLPEISRAYRHHITKIDNFETYFIRYSSSIPRVVKTFPQTKYIGLSHLSGGKEVVDKFIFGLIQSLIYKGYEKITVISSDYDFIDIFHMSNIINENKTIKFTLVIPRPKGRLEQLKSNENIRVIKDR